MKRGRDARVCVIGAGASGITAGKNLLQAGIMDFAVFEQDGDVGGNWRFSDKPGAHSSVFETTFAISSKGLSQFEDFPMPEDYPDYPSHQQILRYFEDYARRFGVVDHVRFNSRVVRAEPQPDDTWRVVLEDGAEEQFDYLLVANGHHWLPRMPSYPGQFTGEMLHSHDYKSAAPFKGKRVLVIGGGNSGCDIAVETSRVSEYTAISLRRGYYVWPKFVLGMTADRLAQTSALLPRFVSNAVGRLVNYVYVGSYGSYGLERPRHAPEEQHPIVNSELLYYIRHGRIRPRRDIQRFEGRKVYFTDGRVEEFDAIIAATGFVISHPFFDKTLIDYSDGDVPLYLRVFHPRLRGLAFIGLVQPVGCLWSLSDWQSKLIASYIAGDYELPRDIRRLIGEDVRRIRGSYYASPRHTIEVDYFGYLAKLKKAIPKRPPSRAGRQATGVAFQ